MTLIDLTGKRFNHWTVLSLAESRRGNRFWLCQCVCGRLVERDGKSVRTGHSKSCGCVRNIHTRQGFTKHGGAKARTPEYVAWQNMIGRCGNPNHPEWHNYGGRGIGVCDRWRSFELFLADVGVRPSPELSLDRYPDNDGNYEPGNVRWATKWEQKANFRPNRWVTLNNITLHQSEWARRLGVSGTTLRARLEQWERAGVRGYPSGHRGRWFTIAGVTLNLNQWARRLGMSPAGFVIRFGRWERAARQLAEAEQQDRAA